MTEPVIKRYTYRHAPTLAAFAADDSFVRGVMGPFGSGKSSACVMEVIRRARQMPRGPDGKRRSRWAVIRNCYDDQTEILTELRGWQFFRNLTPDDKVAMLDGDDLVFASPTHYYAAPYKGPMVQCEMQNLNFCVTPDHKLYASRVNGRTKERAPYKFHLARDVVGKTNYEFRLTCGWSGVDPGYSEGIFELLGFHYAEGWCQHKDGRYNWVLTQKDTSYITSLLDSLGLMHSVIEKQQHPSAFLGEASAIRIFVSGEQRDLVTGLIERLSGQTAHTKRLPNWIKQAPPGHLRAFLRGHREGDGYTRTGKSDTTRHRTMSAELANDLQEIAIKAGFSAVIAERPSGERVVTVLTGTRSSPQPFARSWSQPEYDGIVYCLEVPTHIVLVRRKGRALWCSQTYNQLKDTTIRTFHDWVPPEQFGTWKVSEFAYLIDRLDPEIELEVLFRALDRPDQVNNLLSTEYTGAWINEAREVPKEIVDGLTGRVGRFPPAAEVPGYWSGIIMDTNPPDTDSWWYRLFEESRPEGYRLFRQPSGLADDAENLPFLKPDYYRRLMQGKDPDWVKVYVEGEYGILVAGKPVFPEYRDFQHAREVAPNRDAPLYVGIDFGLTPAATIGQFIHGQWRIVREVVSEDMGAMRFGELLKSVLSQDFGGYKVQAITGDPAGEQRAQTDERTPFDVLRVAGIDAIPADTNDFTIRREAVAKHLQRLTMTGEPGLVVSHGCPILRKGLAGGYCYRKLQVSGEARYREVPDKNRFSHVCFVAGTQIDTPSGPRSIEDLYVGATVSTPLGPRRIIAAGSRLAEVKTYPWGTCTPDHPIWTLCGYSPADAIKYPELTATRGWLWRSHWKFLRSAQRRNGRFLSFLACAITGSRRATTSATSEPPSSTCTAPSGWRTTVRSLMGTTSTIATGIAATTILRIWSALRAATISASTCRRQNESANRPARWLGSLCQRLRSGAAIILKSLPRSPVSVSRPIWSPTATSSQSPALAFCVAGSSSITPSTPPGSSSVARPAALAGASSPGSMTKNGSACSAESRSPSTATSATSPVPSIARVYSLEVEEAHSYYANGTLVSNCDSLQYLLLGAGEGVSLIVPTGSASGWDITQLPLSVA